jgi:zinc transporter 9
VRAAARSRAHPRRAPHAAAPPRAPPARADRLSGGLHSHSHGVALPAASTDSPQAGDDSAKSKSALLGMIVHAAVDGVALGAAIKEGDSALGLLVFVAIMLHKAPSSFGLATYLLHHGITPEGVKRRLLVFSSAAPLGAFATYMLLSLSTVMYKQELLSVLLLFSGGTFLYVATAHVLPEILAGTVHHDEEPSHEGCAEGSHPVRQRTPPKMKWSETALLVSGVLLPLLLDVHHGH